MAKKWIIKSPVNHQLKNLYPELDEIVLQLLADRGLTEQKEIDEFLNPDYEQDIHDPFLFTQMRQAVDRIKQAIENKESIIVHGDYDADGLGGSVILVSLLRYLGAASVDVYLPHREKEGYGVNKNTIDYLLEQNVTLMITCDCGISNIDEIAYARSKGIDVIVTDHHTQKDQLPDAIILHPKVRGENYPFKDLAGGGVAFKLAQAVLADDTKHHPEKTRQNISFEKWSLDMVAISSIADMVPLIGENRTLVKYGLIVLSKARRPGIKALLKSAGKLPLSYGKELRLTPFDVGFIIAPRLNAAGRIDHSNIAFALLMEQNQVKARQLAEQLDQTNRDRRQITMNVMNQALNQIGPVERGASVLMAQDDDWPMGVVGLVAGRISEKYHRPVFICGSINGRIAGSGRSIEGFDCTEALDSAKDLFYKYGGHPMACGFTINDNQKFIELKNRFNQFARKNLKSEQLIPKLEIDTQLSISQITWDFFEALQKFEPFGMKNPQPKFLSKQVEVIDARAVGADKNHLRMDVTRDHEIIRKCIAFRLGEWAPKLRPGDKIDIVYTIDINEWNGNRELQLKVIDINKS